MSKKSDEEEPEGTSLVKKLDNYFEQAKEVAQKVFNRYSSGQEELEKSFVYKFIFSRLPRLPRGVALAIIFVLTVLVYTGFFPLSFQVESVCGATILDFQLALTKDRMDRAISACEPVLDDVRLTFFYDFMFVVVYSLLVATFSFNLAQEFHRFFPAGIASFNFKFMVLTSIPMIVLAAIMNVVQNIFALIILFNTHNYPQSLVYIVSFAAIIKFLLIIVVGTVDILGAVVLFYHILFRNGIEHTV